MSEITWVELDRLWDSFEIDITEVDDEKTATFIFKDYDSLKWVLKTFARFKGGSNHRIEDMDKYMKRIPDPIHEGEDVEFWEDYDINGFHFTLTDDSVIVFPKIPAIVYSGYSFHHFFQHMFDWLPSKLDRALHSLNNRRIPIATFKDEDGEIPVSRGMISSGFMIHSQKEIEDVWDNSIKKWFIALNNDDRYNAEPSK